MTMELNSKQVTAKVTKAGFGAYSAEAGEEVEIEVAGDKKLEATVPEGKKWINILINISLDEVDE